MRDVKLKVCGMREPQNINEVAQLRPDFLGFIFYEKSKRYVGPAFSLEGINVGSIPRVGVFVNEDLDIVISKVKSVGLDYVQLHGDESPEYCKKAHDLGLTVIKAVGITPTFEFAQLEDYKPFVKHFLFDTKSDAYGGTGHKFDWEILNSYDQEISFFLSGGLGIDEVKNLLAADYFGWNIFAVDVNSKFEDSPGLKNVERLRALRELLQ